jgi:thiol-disulfide isomerase/thioredoxin
MAALMGPVVSQVVAQSSSAKPEPGVVVLDEKDFQQVPEAVRGQSLSGAAMGSSGALSIPASPASGEILRFDPRRDAAQDVRTAVAAAARTGKHVLIEVGGNWCPYCKVLDQFFAANPQVNALRQKNFLFVKVNFSEENQNEALLRNYPQVRGFPHFFVVNGKGELVRSQRVATLGTQTGYSPERFTAFLKAFAPQP